MKYETKSDLPDTVQTALPEDAQNIYRTTFNKVWEIYGSESEQGDTSREAAAHRDAWTAVMKVYNHDQEHGIIYPKGENPEEIQTETAEQGFLGKTRSWFRETFS